MLALVAAAAAARPDAPAAALAALDADLARLDHLMERRMDVAVADLSQPFVATFQAVARAAKFVGGDWRSDRRPEVECCEFGPTVDG